MDVHAREARAISRLVLAVESDCQTASRAAIESHASATRSSGTRTLSRGSVQLRDEDRRGPRDRLGSEPELEPQPEHVGVLLKAARAKLDRIAEFTVEPET